MSFYDVREPAPALEDLVCLSADLASSLIDFPLLGGLFFQPFKHDSAKFRVIMESHVTRSLGVLVVIVTVVGVGTFRRHRDS